ncbi:histidine phosphatase family protein [Nocardioides dongxiaopingii]|uniref:histidine phosphatase family protein n=1 Tax=Nocardioides dongxiaopingii TaxID=2576036 RepID=UPI0010C769A3|nr:histidine phosphatase family protein [Nocardioides dongxiaopingii]
MRLYLLRHGQTPSNVSGALDTSFPGAELTALGIIQAQAIPGVLASENVRAVYASELVRAQLTAHPLADHLGVQVQVRTGLEEIAAGDLEMSSDEASVRAYAACLASWMHGDLGCKMPGGPSGREFVDRYDAAIDALVQEHPHETAVTVVSHGAAIRVWVALAAGLRPEDATDLRLANTGMGVLDREAGSGWTLTRWVADPVGGQDLTDERAHDVTGESAEEVI